MLEVGVSTHKCIRIAKIIFCLVSCFICGNSCVTLRGEVGLQHMNYIEILISCGFSSSNNVPLLGFPPSGSPWTWYRSKPSSETISASTLAPPLQCVLQNPLKLTNSKPRNENKTPPGNELPSGCETLAAVFGSCWKAGGCKEIRWRWEKIASLRSWNSIFLFPSNWCIDFFLRQLSFWQALTEANIIDLIILI